MISQWIDRLSRPKPGDVVWARRWPSRIAAGFAAGLCAVSVVSASEGDYGPPSSSDYIQTMWAEGNGLPSSRIFAIAQSNDGYIWLGTDAGLVKFDGVRFRLWNENARLRLPEGTAPSVLASRDGSIWVGFAGGPGGVGRIIQHDLHLFGPDEGFESAVVTDLHEDRHGQIWASSTAGLHVFEGTRWRRITKNEGLPDGTVHNSFEDSQGTMWLATAVGLYRREKTSHRFEFVRPGTGFFQRFIEDAFGRVWVTDGDRGLRLLSQGISEPKVDEFSATASRVFKDRSGDIWIATRGNGLWRARVTSTRLHISRLTTTTPLSGDVRAVFEDRDGNLWIGTSSGLHLLSRRLLSGIEDIGSVRAIEATRDGRVWLGMATGIIALTGNGRQQFGVPDGMPSPFVNGLHVTANDVLWAATSTGLARLSEGRFQPLPHPDNARLTHVFAIASDANGGVWACNRGEGLFRWDGKDLQRIRGDGHLDDCGRTYATAHGRYVWVSLESGTMARVWPDLHYEIVDPASGTRGPTAVQVIYETADGTVWIGTSTGLTGLRSAEGPAYEFPMLSSANVRSIVADSERNLWVGTNLGIMRLNVGRGANPHVGYELFDDTDGLAGVPIISGTSGAVLHPDGTLWFATANGITNVKPQLIQRRGAALPVYIEEMTADARALDATGSLALPARTRTVQFEYASVSFSSPTKTRFQYLLEGFNSEWVNAGVRRSAVYTNLPPGSYRFRVKAIDKRGVESEAGPVSFSIAPALYQTWRFLVFFVASVVLTTALAWRSHLKRIRRDFALVLSERIRISREIHDTLLQNLIGIALRIDTLTDRLDDPTSTRQALIKTRVLAEEHIRETRQSIRNLRSTKLDVEDFPAAIQRMCVKAADDSEIRLAVNVSGDVRRLQPDTEQQLLRIAEEAVANAVRHSRCSEIRVTLEYHSTGMRLRVVDDGTGFDPTVLHGDSARYGLTSMRERAEEAGGALTISSRVDEGTVVEAVIPEAALSSDPFRWVRTWLSKRSKFASFV